MGNINYCLLLLKDLFKIEATSEDVGYVSNMNEAITNYVDSLVYLLKYILYL